ncbi:MAG: TonB-dependent receptor [Candidatus Latescibacteria bacterium]|nr:TonB-dependent receptor [Candidatus Latescibacterota bacterium]
MRQLHWFLVTLATLLGLLVTLSQPGAAAAQEPGGTIRGKVVDAQTGEPLTGAYVFLAGTQIGAVCDLEGAYVLRSVVPGAYALTSSMIGYNKVTVAQVVVVAGKEARLDLSLQPEAIATQEVVVEAQKIRNTDAALLRDRQKAAALSDAISAQEIARAGSGDAAQAMAHVTGAAVEEGKYVVIRGLGDRYSAVQLNGVVLPSADPNKRSVAMDLFPTSLLDNIVTVKSFTPDRPGNFTGGAVDIGTKAFPDHLTLSLSASTTYNPQVSFKDGVLGYAGGKWDWLGVDDGTRELPATLKTVQQVPDIGASYTDLTQARQLDRASKAFTPVMAPSTRTGPLSQGYTLGFGHQLQVLGRPLGFLSSFTYSSDQSSYDQGRTARWKLTNRVDRVDNLIDDYQLQDSRSNASVLWGGLLTANYRFRNNHQVGLTWMDNHSSDDVSRYLYGSFPRDLEEQATYETRVLHFVERRIQSLQLNGKDQLSPKLRLQWRASLSGSRQDEPDLRYFTDNFTIWERGGVLDTLYSIQTAIYPSPTRYFRKLREDNGEVQADLSRTLALWNGRDGTLKAGANLLRTTREFSERRYAYGQDNILYDGNAAAFFEPAKVGLTDTTGFLYRFGNFVQEVSDPSSNYDGTQHIWAGYLMGDLPLSRRLRLITGARLETTRMRVQSQDTTLAPGRLNTKDLLPSLNLVYQVTENMNLRASYGRTLARPTFREMAPYASFDFVGDFTLIGNKGLKRTLVHNYDLRWEMFANPGELVAVSAFLKDFRAPIERAILTDNGEIQFQNVDEARVAGLEMETHQSLARLAPRLRCFFAGANLSLIHSRVSIPAKELLVRRSLDPLAGHTRPLQGQSPFLLNLDLTYDGVRRGLTAGLYYNLFGRRLSEVSLGGTPDVYEQARGNLQFTLAKSFLHLYRLKFTAANLLDSPFEDSYRFKGRDFSASRYRSGRSYSLALAFNFSP